MKNIIFFDFDGTLVDCEKYQTQRLKQIFQKHNVDTSNINFKELIGPPLFNTFLKYIKNEDPNKVLEEYNNTFDPNFLQGISVFGGVVELLKNLRKLNYKICVVSLQLKKIVDAELKYLNLKSYVDEVFCDSVKKPYKSKIDLVNDVIIKNNFKKSEIVFVGDTYNDVVAGKQNNILSIGVLWGYGNIKQQDVDFVAKDSVQLFDILKSLKEDA